MKVLTVVSKLEMGGIEKTLLSCIPHLQKNEVHVDILCSTGGELDAKFQQLGVKLIDFGNYKSPLCDFIKLFIVLKNNKYDVVHSRYGHTSGLFAVVCWFLKIPLFVSTHNEKAMFLEKFENTPILKYPRKGYLLFHKFLTVKFATKIIGHSKANLRYYTKGSIANSKLYDLVYNGVDFSRLNDYTKINDTVLSNFISDASKVILHIGKFKRQKNHYFLIDVFHKLNPIKNNYKLILLGNGPLMKDCIAQVKSLGVSDCVFFAGMVNDIRPYLAVSDVFFFPSLYEGFGNVLIEAQYTKIAICASDIAPHYEAAFEKYYTYFFNPTDTNNAVLNLTNCIASLEKTSHNDTLIKGYEFSNEFSVSNMATKLSKLYKSL